MSQGTLYVGESSRGLLLKGLIKHYKLDINVTDRDATYQKLFPLGKVPAFVGPKGYKLTEVIAIVLYGEFIYELIRVQSIAFCFAMMRNIINF